MFAVESPIRPITKELPKVTEPSTRVGNELQSIDNLIEVTQENLERQKHLKVLVKEYLQVREHFIENMDDNQLALRMLALANQLSEEIENQHLLHLFDQEFIGELHICNQISQKK